jgi:hypothetical protein
VLSAKAVVVILLAAYMVTTIFAPALFKGAGSTSSGFAAMQQTLLWGPATDFLMLGHLPMAFPYE